MGQVLHGSARTTAAVRRAIQQSQESLRSLAKRHGINPKTVAKWKKRPSVQDERTGPKEPRSTVLTLDEEAIVVAFRRHTLLPLDDCLYALQATIPRLTRSSLHRCLKRHGISRLPNTEGDKPRRAQFKRYPIGYFHIDLAEVRTEQGKLYLLVAIDRTSKFAFVELHERVTRRVAGNFLRALITAVPYRVHTVLTDNGTHFTEPSGNTWTPAEIKEMLARKQLFRAHAFELACAQNDVEHRLTKPRRPWTNGQVERMNRTIKEATVQRFYYATHDQLRTHLADFVAAYNFARRLKTLKGLTPYEFICKRWTLEPERFRLDPLHQMPGLIPARVKADSFWGFQSGASLTPWWRTGGSPCGQGLPFVRTMMRPSFGHGRKRPGMRGKVGVCWRWPRSTTVAPGPRQRGSAASGCRPFGTGLCGSTPAVLKA